MYQKFILFNKFNVPSRVFVILTALSGTAMAGGYVDGSTALDTATAIDTGGTSIIPTFNNEQFNDKVLVGSVNNDLVRTPSTADPVSTVSGNNYHDETDIQIRGRNDLGYVFTRTYNSASSATEDDRGLGYGWVHSYAMRLESNDFGICPNCDAKSKPENANAKTSSITYTDERGGEQNFLVNESTFAVTNPKGVFDQLALDSPVAGQHTLTFRNGVKYTFETNKGNLKTTPNGAARLKTIENPWGDKLTLYYDAGGRLQTIKDNLNIATRTGLTFTYYGTTSHIQDITDWTGRKWHYDYTNNDLTGKTNPLLETVTYKYQPGHLLSEVIQPMQRNGLAVKTTFNYYRNGRVFNYYDSLGNTETLDYDLYRKLTRVTDPRGGIREYTYDADGFMTKMIEPDGAVLVFESQTDGLRNKKYDALGYATQYSYLLTGAFADDASTTFGNVSSEKDAFNYTIDTSYGIYDQVATLKDKRGIIINTSYYTAAGSCSKVGRPQSVTLSKLNTTLVNVKLRDYCWNSDGTLKTLTEYIDATDISRQRTTQYTYEAGSSNLKVSDINISGSGKTRHTHFTYDALGRKQTETLYRQTSPTNTAPLALTTQYSYDNLDRLVKVTDPEGNIHETVFDSNGQIYQEKTWYSTAIARANCAAPAGGYVVCVDATHEYDAADHRVANKDIFGFTTQFAYDEAGNLVKITDANHHSIRYEYDAMNRKTAVIDGNGRRIETKYDLAGHAIAVTNGNGKTVKNEYDKLGRLTKVTDPLGADTQFKYDANGNLYCLIDANEHIDATDPSYQPLNANGCTEWRGYDELNRLTTSKNAANFSVVYSYDLLNNRTTVKDAKAHITTFNYNDLGQLEEIVDPLVEIPTDKTETFVYDQADNLIQETDRKGQISQHTYDLLNRPIQTDHLADGSGESAFYDDFGDLVESKNSGVTYTYVYTSKHQLKSKTDSRQNKKLGWTYDAAGNLKTKTDYQNDITTYQYDNANRLVAETNPAYLQASYHYDGAGRLLDRILSSGALSQYQYDAADRLKQLKNITATGKVVNNTQYTYDHTGNRLSQTDTGGAGQWNGARMFTYSPVYQLLSVDYVGNTLKDEAYSYDAVGNRLTATAGSLVTTADTLYYTYNAGNRLVNTKIGSLAGPIQESYSYDDNGSLKTITLPADPANARNLVFTWDANNRLIKADAVSFGYDPSGYRIQKIPNPNPANTKNYYLEGEHLEAVYDGQAMPVLQAKYFRGSVIDEIINGYQLNAGGALINSSYHHDALQSVLGQSGHDGDILAAQSYTAFGRPLNQSGASNNPMKYTGRELDGGTGFYYYRARYYDPVIGRFISEDPKGFGAGVNFYVYAGNNPINANDPTGKDAQSVTLNAGQGLAIGAAGAVVVGVAAVGAVAVGVPVAVVTVGLGAVAIVNTGITSYNIGTDIQNSNWDGVAYNAGSLVGSLAVGAATGSAVAFGVNGVKGAPFTWNDSAQNYNSSLGSIPTWLGTGPNIGSAGLSVGAGGSAASSLLGGSASPADGGFVLYPNMSNTNMMTSVYNKK